VHLSKYESAGGLRLCLVGGPKGLLFVEKRHVLELSALLQKVGGERTTAFDEPLVLLAFLLFGVRLELEHAFDPEGELVEKEVCRGEGGALT
jgi:hypothetical protein